jgi:peptidoglycan/LPS O-acetylase OafA/YrhL
VSTTLTVTTGVQTAALSLPGPHSMPNTPLFALLGGGSLLGWWSRRRRGRKTGLPRHWPPTSLFLGIFLLSIAGAAALSGCGGSGHATPSGTDTISITAQSGSITQTQTFTLTVQ